MLEVGSSAIEIPWLAILAYLFFTGLNIVGVKAAAMFELAITVLAVVELLIFAGVTLPEFEVVNPDHQCLAKWNPWNLRCYTICDLVFLAIEGVANVAEETIILKKCPSRVRIRNLDFSNLCLLTFTSSVGVAGWEAVVYDANGDPSDSLFPSPLHTWLVIQIHVSPSINHWFARSGRFVPRDHTCSWSSHLRVW